MKKVLSFALVLAMILGSVSMVFAAATSYPDIKGIDAEEAINVLTGLGVLEGYPDGTFKPEGKVTRAEMVKMICAALALPVTEGTYTTKFTDVKPDAWYSAYVYYAITLGIIEGKSETIFDPQGNVTYDQAITMVMRALGYTEAGLNGVYPSAFVSKAVGLGALKGLVSGSEDATREDMAQLIYNVIDKQIGKTGQDDVWFDNGEPDNMLLRLGAQVAENEDGETIYMLVDMDVIQDEDTLVDLSGLFGQVISYYVNDDDQIVAVAEQVTEELTGTYYLDSSATGDGYFLIGTTKFYGNQVVGAATENGDEADFTWFVNTEENGNTIDDLIADDTESSYTFAVTYKGAKIEKVYSVAKWSVTSSDVIDEDALEDLEGTKPSLLGEEFALNDDDEIDTNKFILNGAENVEAIEAGNVVYVYSNGENIVRVDVGTKVVTGTVEEILSNGKVVVDGTTYARAKVSADTVFGCDYDSDIIDGTMGASKNGILNNLTAGNDYVLYLGYGDKLYAVAGVAETDYVVFLKYQAAQNELTIDGSVAKIEVLNQKGEDVVYEIKASYNEELENTAPAEAGDIVALKLNNSDKVIGIEVKAAFEDAANSSINSKGLVDNSSYLKTSTVVFTYDDSDDADLTDADSWSIIKPETLFGEDASLYGYADGSNYVVVVAAGFESSQDDWVILTGWSKIQDHFRIKVLADGTTVTYLSDENVYTDANVGANANLYTLTLDSSGSISEITEFADNEAKTLKMVELATSGAIKVSGDFVTQGDSIYTLADDAIVYVWDISDSAWTTTTKSGLSLKDGGYNKVVLYDTLNDEDELFNYAIVVKN